MALQEKYKDVLDAASAGGVSNLQVTEQDGVLYVNGDAPSAALKDQLWEIYGKIDPDFGDADLVLNVNATVVEGTSIKVATESSSLNIRKGPGTSYPIVGKAGHGEVITLVNKSNEEWWMVRTSDGEEGYAYSQYLEPVV